MSWTANCGFKRTGSDLAGGAPALGPESSRGLASHIFAAWMRSLSGGKSHAQRPRRGRRGQRPRRAWSPISLGHFRSATRHIASFFLSLATLGLFAQTPSASTNVWHSLATGRDLTASLIEPEGGGTDKTPPLVIYLKNLASPRAGTESDDSILAGLRREGCRVAILDYAGHPQARTPFLNRDLGKLRDDLKARAFLAQYKPDDAHIFILPAGSRLARNVVFYRDSARALAMDVIYPSKPASPAGAVIEFSCDNQDRMGNASLSICSDTLLDAAATEGFATAMADHTVAAPYKGLDPMPECAWKIKAAVRTLRAEGVQWGLNGKIVPVGFSRGSGMALMLATTDGLAEFEGRGEHTNASSSVQGAVVMSGRFTYLDLLPQDKMWPRYAQAWGPLTNNREVWKRQGALDYMTRPVVPLFLTINCSESPEALHQMTVLRKRLAELGNDEMFFMDPEPRGHKVTLAPEILDAMNRYLTARLR